jgi:hypothetical protein
MFKCQKYVSKGIEIEIPEDLQIFIWSLILKMEVQEIDYLQVFRITPEEKDGRKGLKIIHSQEQPFYKREHFFETDIIVTAKIFCIDDESHATMLLASEY